MCRETWWRQLKIISPKDDMKKKTPEISGGWIQTSMNHHDFGAFPVDVPMATTNIHDL